MNKTYVVINELCVFVRSFICNYTFLFYGKEVVIKVSNINLRDYIKNIYYLEKSLYEQRNLDKSLLAEIKSYLNDENILRAVNTNKDFLNLKKSPINVFLQSDIEEEASYQRVKDNKKNNSIFYYFESSTFVGLAFLSVVLALIIAVLISIFNKPFKALSPFFAFMFKYSLIIFLILTLIYVIKNLIQYLKERAKNNEENKVINKYNQEVIAKNNKNYENRKSELSNIKREEWHLRNISIKNTLNALNMLYSADIIFPKYRNLIAISSFYEYFESGRCNTLIGHEGAYNIYENEIRLNRIIVQLDIVIDKLEEIKNNQYMLYDAINQTNRTNKKIMSELKSIRNQNADILKNTSISAYNSSIIARNTEILKWYELYVR